MDETKKRKRYKTNAEVARKIRYQKSHQKVVSLRYSIENDSDILEKIASVPNKADYIRQLIRADINKNTD